MPQMKERPASRVTVGLGAGIPRVFKDVLVRVNYEHALVDLYSPAEPQRLLATAPLGATMIEWELCERPRHRISIPHEAQVTA